MSILGLSSGRSNPHGAACALLAGLGHFCRPLQFWRTSRQAPVLHQGENFMSIRLAISTAAAGVFALGLAVAVPGEALAQANVLKECGSQYQAAKAANQLNGQSWQEYLKACRARIAEPTAAPAAATPAPTP